MRPSPRLPRPSRPQRGILALLAFLLVFGLPLLHYGRFTTRRKQDPPPSSTAPGFRCPPAPRSYPLPFQWFCHDSQEGVTMEGPQGQVNLEYIGQIHGEGPHIFSFPSNLSGPARVLWKGSEVASFTASPEPCKCPKPLEEFVKEYTCSERDRERVGRIFERWLPKTVTRETLEERSRNMLFKPVGHYAIIGNEIYFRLLGPPSHGKTFARFTLLLQAVARKVALPNIEFLFHATDYPLVPLPEPTPHVFAYCTSPVHSDIMVPSNDLIKEAFTGEAFRFAAQGQPWESRLPKAYFRGSNTGPHVKAPSELPFHNRYRAALLAASRPDLFDVKVLPLDRVRLADAALDWAVARNLTTLEELPKTSAMKSRFLLGLDGNAAAFRTSSLLISGSTLVKQGSPYSEYFYEELQAGEHYLAVDNNLKSLIEVVEWAQQHDEDARAIAARATEFYSTRLRQEDLLCWMAFCLHQVAPGLAVTPTVATLPADMGKLDSPVGEHCEC